MQTVTEAWKTAQLQTTVPESFLEISYRVTDPAAELDASASDNGHTDFSNTAQIVDQLDKTYEKYVTLEQNIWLLDGTFPVLPETVTQDMGFASEALSGADCVFETPPVVTLSFSQIHANVIPGLTIQWSTAFDEFPWEYVVTAYGGGTVVAQETFTGNTSPTSFATMDIADYDRIEITINEWCLPYHRARLEAVTVGAVKIFTKTNIMGYAHTQTADLLSMELPKTEIVFDINNVDAAWNPDNPTGVFKYLLERQEIVARYGFKVGGAVEWIPGGVYYMSGWETPQNGITASFTARDVLDVMSDPISLSPGSYTLLGLCTAAFEQAGLPLLSDGRQRWLLGSSLGDITVTLPTKDDGTLEFGYTCAEVVQLCANAGRCVMYQDREGVMHVEPLSDTLTDYVIGPFISYANAEYSISKDLKSVSVNEGLGTAQNSTQGEIQEADNPLVQSAEVAADVAVWIRDVLKNRKTLSGEFRADPRVDVLDAVTVENKFATSRVVLTDVRFTYNGAFRGSYEGRVIP